MIIFMGRLFWWSHFDDLLLSFETLPLFGIAHAELLCVRCLCESAGIGSMYLTLCLHWQLAPMHAHVSSVAASGDQPYPTHWFTPQPTHKAYFWGWVTLWSAEEMLDGRQRVDIPAHARTANFGLPQNRLKEDLCWMVPWRPSWSRDWT